MRSVSISKGIIAWLKSPSNYVPEILLLLAWTLWVGRAYLNFDPFLWPFGREYGLAVHTHFIWENLLQCGTCMFWNGAVNGGSPAFAELQGAVLHPIVILTTLLAGVVNGSKLTLLCSLFMAGMAQWWLAKNMNVGRLARIWSAAMGVVSGHLAARMEPGLVDLVLSTATCSLALAAGVDLALKGNRRAAIRFGVILSLGIVSGQGYMQIGFLLCILPAFLVFILQKKDRRLLPLWKEFLLAGVLALLLAGVFLVPLLHFFPNFDKPSDPLFAAAQKLTFLPLNLVINDLAYYTSEILHPTAFPSLYANYLGWIPVILAVLTLCCKPRNSNRWWAFFLISIGLSFLAGSGTLFKALIHIFPNAAQVRFVSYIAGYANPLILCLSACGLDGLLNHKWLQFPASDMDKIMRLQERVRIGGIKLVILIALLAALRSAYVFGQQWLGVPNNAWKLVEIANDAETDTTEWVSVPGGDHYWNVSLQENGLKIGDAVASWYWKDSPLPPVYIAISRDSPISPEYYVKQTIGDINIYVYPENEYAYIEAGEHKFACTAVATGGNIDVVCPDNTGGTLMVMEHNWTGWSASVDGEAIALLDSDWLSVQASAGEHTYSFRYRPWDVWVGLLVSLFGVVLCFVLWNKKE